MENDLFAMGKAITSLGHEALSAYRRGSVKLTNRD
jgi:hypothetical protein